MALKGVNTVKPMVEDISLANQRRAKDVFSLNVDQHLGRMKDAGNRVEVH